MNVRNEIKAQIIRADMYKRQVSQPVPVPPEKGIPYPKPNRQRKGIWFHHVVLPCGAER